MNLKTWKNYGDWKYGDNTYSPVSSQAIYPQVVRKIGKLVWSPNLASGLWPKTGIDFPISGCGSVYGATYFRARIVDFSLVLPHQKFYKAVYESTNSLIFPGGAGNDVSGCRAGKSGS